MKNKIKSKLKKLLSPWYLTKIFVVFIGIAVVSAFLVVIAGKIVKFVDNPVEMYEIAEVNAKAREEENKAIKFDYNEQVPKEIVKEEIIKQSKEYGNDIQFMLDLAECESGFNSLAKNPNSTALGVYQWLIKSWEGTDSFKDFKIARTDYKINIEETMIAIKKGEAWRWKECLTK